MSNGWDRDINLDSLTFEERNALEAREREEQRAIARAARGYFTPAIIEDDVVRDNFVSMVSEQRTYSNMLGPWTTNRIIWMCHDCGMFGYKFTTLETSKCRNWNCKSRNITVCRAGELSMLIRSVPDEQKPGVNMTNVFEARKKRLKEARKARKESGTLVGTFSS